MVEAEQEEVEMKHTLFALALASCSHEFHAKRKPTPLDISLQASFYVSAAIDLRQSYKMTELCSEANPITGPCGDRVPLYIYAPVALIGHAAISYLLTGHWRTTWLGVTFGAEASIVYSNWVIDNLYNHE